MEYIMKFRWEIIHNNTSGGTTKRAKVLGGWIVNFYDYDTDSLTSSQSMVFVPDPQHEWEIEK